MGLEIPDLDDRSFDELLEDARKRLPVYSEEWTDHNVHDPGITILEVLVWLAETYRYQLDRLTDEDVARYLRLLGHPPEPPKSATAPLAFTLPAERPNLSLPARERLVVTDREDVQRVFETVQPVHLTQARVARIVSEHRQGRTDNTTANDTPEMSFLAFGERAALGSTMYLGFDADPFAASERVTLSLSYDDSEMPPGATHGDEPVEFDPSVALDWQFCATPEESHRATAWTGLDVVDDGTDVLYHGGTITLENRRAEPVPAGAILDIDEAYHWLRVSVARPRRLSDDADSTAEDAFPDPSGTSGDDGWDADPWVGYEVPPRLDAVETSRVPAVHGTAVDAPVELKREDNGTGTTARANQTFVFDDRPVQDAQITVGGRRWRERPDFDASGPDDRHYTLDRSGGRVHFGDGVRGTVPEAGQAVVATQYTVGGGADGNVSTPSRWHFDRAILSQAGVYRYADSERRDAGMRGAIVVSDPDASPTEPDYGDWFDGVDAFTGTDDQRGMPSVTVSVGTVDDGVYVFDPPAIHVDAGTRVDFEWQTRGHDLVVDSAPDDATWTGHVPAAEAPSGHTYSHVFPAPADLSTLGVAAVDDATGGTDAESVRDALVRLRKDMDRPYRAVTLADYEYVARHTPGLRFGRAKALVESGTRTEECAPHDDVAVVVVPYSPLDRPMPSAGFLEAVYCHLKRHTLLTDRVSVRRPQYVGVGIDATVRVDSDAAASDRAAAVEAALAAFVHPLTGFEGSGWPFGRPLYRSEVNEVIEGVPGVECVLDLSIRAVGEFTRQDGAIEIDEDTLLYSLDHDVTVPADPADCGRGY